MNAPIYFPSSHTRRPLLATTGGVGAARALAGPPGPGRRSGRWPPRSGARPPELPPLLQDLPRHCGAPRCGVACRPPGRVTTGMGAGGRSASGAVCAVPGIPPARRPPGAAAALPQCPPPPSAPARLRRVVSGVAGVSPPLSARSAAWCRPSERYSLPRAAIAPVRRKAFMRSSERQIVKNFCRQAVAYEGLGSDP